MKEIHVAHQSILTQTGMGGTFDFGDLQSRAKSPLGRQLINSLLTTPIPWTHW